MIIPRPGEHVLTVYDSGNAVFMLAAVHDHQLFVAPVGSPPFTEDRGLIIWVHAGPVDDLPAAFGFGWDIRDAYRRLVAALS